jgi:hypothetical protein
MQAPTMPLAKDKITNGTCAWVLGRGAVRSLQLRTSESVHVQVLSGVSWITLESDVEDHVLFTGSSETFHGPGQLVLEALHADTSLRLESAAF